MLMIAVDIKLYESAAARINNVPSRKSKTLPAQYSEKGGCTSKATPITAIGQIRQNRQKSTTSRCPNRAYSGEGRASVAITRPSLYPINATIDFQPRQYAYKSWSV